MSKFAEILAKLENVCMYISGIAVVILMFLTIIDVSGRSLFSIPLIGSTEMAQMAMIVAIFLAIAGTQRMNGHVGMDMVIDKFKSMNRPVYPVIQSISLLLVGTFFIFVLYYATNHFILATAEKETTGGPFYLSSWPFRGVLCFGLLLMVLRLAIQLVQTIRVIPTWRQDK